MATHDEPMDDQEAVVVNNDFILVWLDDSSEDDPAMKAILCTIFNSVITTVDPEICIKFIDSDEIKSRSVSVLISGKYGQILVPGQLEKLDQVKNVFVYCIDTIKHSRWANNCNKVRCVFSDFNKILDCMQFTIQNGVLPLETQDTNAAVHFNLPPVLHQEQQHRQEQPQEPEEEIHVDVQEQQRERFVDENNLFDQLAFNLILQSLEDGTEDFTNFCRTQTNNSNNPEQQNVDGATSVQTPDQYYRPEQPIEEWYQPDLCFLNINSNDLVKLWTLRWFIRSFHQQLIDKHKKFIENKTKFSVYYGTWLMIDELEAIKHRIGKMIIMTELLSTFTDRDIAANSIVGSEANQNKVLFEITIDPSRHDTIPYAELKEKNILLWFGARYHLTKIEFIEEQNDAQDGYWLIGLNLQPTLNSKPSIQNLYQFYLKQARELNDVRLAFGRILMHKGSYRQAAQWLQTNNYYQELAELSIRQGRYDLAKQCLEQLPHDCHEANLLRAYLHILTAKDTWPKARSTAMKIISEASDKLIRAQANTILGFIHLIVLQQLDLALEHFTIANEVLRKILPDIHPLIAKSYIGLGYANYMLHKIPDARLCFQTSLEIQQQSLAFNHPDTAAARSGLAHCLATDKKQCKQAIEELEYAMDILLDTYHYQQHPQVTATKDDMDKLRKGKALNPRTLLLDFI